MCLCYNTSFQLYTIITMIHNNVIFYDFIPNVYNYDLYDILGKVLLSRLVSDISNLSDDNIAVVSRLGIVSAPPLLGAGSGLMIRLSVLSNSARQPDKLVH